MQTALLGKQKDHWANGLVSKEQELSEEGSNRLLAAVGATVVRSRRRKKKQVEHFPERGGILTLRFLFERTLFPRKRGWRSVRKAGHQRQRQVRACEHAATEGGRRAARQRLEVQAGSFWTGPQHANCGGFAKAAQTFTKNKF